MPLPDEHEQQKPPERYFYHSFPRSRNPPRTDEQALEMLRGLVEIGFVLTPEQTEWREPLKGGGFRSPDVVKQVRICFTELSPLELKGHAYRFGQFALEFEILTLRKLTALPVVYLPSNIGDGGPGDAAGATIVARLSQITRLLDRLQQVKKSISVPRCPPFLTLEHGEGRKVAVAVEELLKFMSVLEAGIQSFEQLIASLRVFSSFIAQTENLRYNDILDYYRQREWRICAGLTFADVSLSHPITDSQKERLLRIDPDFFGGFLEFRGQRFRRVDFCHVMSEYLGAKVAALSRRVIVPKRCLAEASKILSEAGLSDLTIVTLEAL